jgi:phage terminase large subunit-like protein
MNNSTNTSVTSIQPSLRNSELRQELLRAAQERHRRVQGTKLYRYRPYLKQREFHAAGAIYRERLLMAANQVGKSLAGSAEAAFHLTGWYPDWWEGRRWDRPVKAWAGSETSEVTRDGVQRLLVGPPKIEEDWGTGLLPRDSLSEWARKTGVPDALDGIVVKHASGGFSTLGFKSYDQGRQKWQGETLNFVFFDEEPPLDVYTEGLTRTNATNGIVWLTFTPLLGMSDVVASFDRECGPL